MYVYHQSASITFLPTATLSVFIDEPLLYVPKVTGYVDSYAPTAPAVWLKYNLSLSQIDGEFSICVVLTTLCHFFFLRFPLLHILTYYKQTYIHTHVCTHIHTMVHRYIRTHIHTYIHSTQCTYTAYLAHNTSIVHKYTYHNTHLTLHTSHTVQYPANNTYIQ